MIEATSLLHSPPIGLGEEAGKSQWFNGRPLAARPIFAMYIWNMEGLSASVVLIAILLSILLVVVFDAFCLLRLGTANTAHFVPRFVWAVLIVGVSPLGGVVYLLAQRLRRQPEPMTMRPRPLLGNTAWYGPSLTEYRHSPATPLGHGVAVAGIAGAVYLALAGQVLAAVVVAVVLVVIVFLKSTPPG